MTTRIIMEGEFSPQMQRMLMGQQTDIEARIKLVEKIEREDGLSHAVFQVVSMELMNVRGDGTNMAFQEAGRQGAEKLRTMGTLG